MPRGNYSVTYWEVDGKAVLKKNDVCFARIERYGPSDPVTYRRSPIGIAPKLRYLALIDPTILPEETNFYLSFLTRLLDPTLFSAKPLKIGKDLRPHVLYVLNTSGMSKIKNLLYLTAFRYLDEYSDIVKLLYREKETTDMETLFTVFQKIHYEIGRSIGGHALIDTYDKRKLAGISLDLFRTRLKEDKMNSVNDYFRIPAPPPELPKVDLPGAPLPDWP